ANEIFEESKSGQATMGREKEAIPSISHATQNQAFVLTKQYWAHTSLDKTAIAPRVRNFI
ncbi:hypothetical protein PY257_14970, partial [Ramlibacter sp. H39-3-26]|uniref:hypothetical protein n=1 Tax=Curvibacter soli TaxID=3031331 RepID=UPI0023DA79A9